MIFLSFLIIYSCISYLIVSLSVPLLFSYLFLVAKMCEREFAASRSSRRRVRGVLVDPGHGHPLRCSAHQIYSLLQVPDRLIDLVVDDGLVKVVCVCLLEDL